MRVGGAPRSSYRGVEWRSKIENMSREPRRLKDVLDQGQFAVTIEYNPPKGTNISGVLENAKQLVGRVHGVNVTDNTAAIWRAGSLPVCPTPLRTRS